MLRRVASLALSVATIAAGSLAIDAGTRAASAVTITDPQGYTHFIDHNSGKCVDVQNHSTALNTLLMLEDCANVTSQQWALIPDFNGHFLMENHNSGFCAEPSGGGVANDTWIVQVGCAFEPAQEWVAIPAHDHGDLVINANSGTCLDNGALVNDVPMQIWQCSASNLNQTFSFFGAV
jgi:hypothetical protein